MSFSWVPIYEELATALMAYEERQGELIQLLVGLNVANVPALPIGDKTANGDATLTAIDPFTFFASFNRGQSDENRRAVLACFKSHFGLSSEVPTDFRGIPVADKRSSWFFQYAVDRQPDEIPTLWALARQAVTGGRKAIDGATFDRCIRIKTVKSGKMTMGLFWLRPRDFMPLDRRSNALLRAKGVVVPDQVDSWAAYANVLDGAVAALGSDFSRISLDAYELDTGHTEAPRPTRYWVGGHQFGESSKAPEFVRDHNWYIGWERDSDNKSAVAAWSRISEIRQGDLFAIKGYGGKNDLKIYAIGRVESVDAEQGSLQWAPVNVPLFHGKAPGAPGVGTWFETLSEATNPAVLKAVFAVDSEVPRSWVQLDEDCRVRVEPWESGLSIVVNSVVGNQRRTVGTARLLTALVERSLPLKAIGYHPQNKPFQMVGAPPNEGQIRASPDQVARDLFTATGRIKGDNQGSRLRIVVGGTATAEGLHRILLELAASGAVQPPRTRPKLAQNLILHGPPGTGKTFRMRALRSEFAPHGPPSPTPAADVAALPATPDNQFFVTFHPSFTYEDFVEGIRPESEEDGGPVRYPLRAGIFKQACERAVQLAGFDRGLAEFCALPAAERTRLLADAKPAVLFIDEINRGNVARILGELITLIEPDKRLGAEQELVVTLPGSRQRFGVPSNLWIVGTMNTADRSVVALDVALRRRFAFEECPPRPELLDGVLVDGVDLGKLLRTINRRLLVLRDRDHLIGHAFFLPLKAAPTLEGLRRVFGESVLPLLLEYFHDDLGRVGLVLGPSWVRRAAGGDVFAKGFDHDHRDDLAERPVWEIANVEELSIAAFQAIDG